MSDLIDFGAPSKFGSHHFFVEIPVGPRDAVSIFEDFGFEGDVNQREKTELRALVARELWTRIRDDARRDFNLRLKEKKHKPGSWNAGKTKLDRFLGKELCVLAWASNPSIRAAIWGACENLQLATVEIQIDKEDAKTIGEQISRHFPTFALFRADRPSTDEDAEVQDPLKVAITQAIAELDAELEAIKVSVRTRAMEVATRTLGKLRDFDASLAETLEPNFSKAMKWDSLFKLSLDTDDGISINKRGSGVRRLVLFSFFRAEAERIRESSQKANIIYAIEEPETAQHPTNQRKVIESLVAMGEKSLDNYQNFAKAFKVKKFSDVLSEASKANHARLKLSSELKSSYMSGDGELPGTPLRALLYALFELSRETEVDDVLDHLGQTYPHYLRDKKLLAKIADYLADKRGSLEATKTFSPDVEARNARILAEAIRNQKI